MLTPILICFDMGCHTLIECNERAGVSADMGSG
jgi:hypothetical protein